MPSECEEHKFTADGIRFFHADRSMPGTGARQRTYFRVYFCEKCLEVRAKRIPRSRDDHSYTQVKYEASPATSEEKEAWESASW